MVDMHKPTSWGNMLLFPPIIKDKRNEPSMNNHLTALVKRVAELREAGLKACHRIEEFHIMQIRPLAVRRSWHLNARGCPIPVMNLLRVNPLSSPFINDKLILS
jgi:hypothetical protein